MTFQLLKPLSLTSTRSVMVVLPTLEEALVWKEYACSIWALTISARPQCFQETPNDLHHNFCHVEYFSIFFEYEIKQVIERDLSMYLFPTFFFLTFKMWMSVALQELSFRPFRSFRTAR